MTQYLTIGAFALAALAVSPLLASWTTALCTDVQRGWWRPRNVPKQTWLSVAPGAVVLAAFGGLNNPSTAWWLFAIGGAVLALVDVRTHLLPSCLVYPLGVVIALALNVAAALDHDPARLGRALLATASVGACWFLVAFCAPDSLGLGDVRLAALSAALLGWCGWRQVIDGQVAIWVLALLLAFGQGIATRRPQTLRQPIPLGPPLVLATFLVVLW